MYILECTVNNIENKCLQEYLVLILSQYLIISDIFSRDYINNCDIEYAKYSKSINDYVHSILRKQNLIIKNLKNFKLKQ